MAAWPALFLGLAGLTGAAGVAAAAAAAHVGGPNLATAAQMLLAHAPAMLGIAAWLRAGKGRADPVAWAGLAIFAGVALFSLTLAVGALAGLRLFPMAAPTGGFLTIAGWLGLVLAGLRETRR
ncbi:DUF423 domain-containing protein [uncultured Alsobacter sp.]|uniref:DUF423 domain-containing protein n=1 Tax=uncultured Alsobacter sp. TaxID=1748258 RepID=UPI0025E7A4DA|nr:DUF423 domain-containing protein [uncultured Alsobacter sp.]